jgi:hypothetical protein
VGERRRIDPVAVVVGAALLLLSITWFVASDDTYLAVARGVVPGALIAIGVFVLLGQGRSRED